MNYIKAHVRLEGCINRFWTLTTDEGVTEKYYAYEGSPQRESDDERVFDYDQQLGNLLDALSHPEMAYESGWDEDVDTVEYDVDMIVFGFDQSGSITKITLNP